MHFCCQCSFFDKSSSTKLKLKIALRLPAFAAKTRTFQVSRRGWAELHHVNVTGPRQRGVGVRRYHRHHPTPAIIAHCAHCIRLRRKSEEIGQKVWRWRWLWLWGRTGQVGLLLCWWVKVDQDRCEAADLAQHCSHYNTSTPPPCGPEW